MTDFSSAAATADTVLVADGDGQLAGLHVAALRSVGMRVERADTGPMAFELLAQPGLIQVALLDWDLPALSALEICRDYRERGATSSAYLAVLSDTLRKQRLALALDAGADDFLVKPLLLDELVAHVRRGASLSRARQRSQPPLEALRTLCSRALSGELVFQGADCAGRIHLTGGRIAWVHVDTDRDVARAALVERLAIGSEELAAALRESRQGGGHFAEVLVRWGLAARDDVAGALREWFAAKLAAIARADCGSSVFLPASGSATGGPSFALEELLQGPELRSGATPVVGFVAPTTGLLTSFAFDADTAGLRALVQECMRIPGALAAACIDARTARVLTKQVAPGRGDNLAERVRLLAALEAEFGLSEASMTGDGGHHLIHLIEHHGRRLIVYLFVGRDALTVGMARMRLVSAATRVGSATEPNARG